MRYIKGISSYQWGKSTAVTLGKFDGLHLGHQMLVDKIREYGANGCESVLCAFDMQSEFDYLQNVIDLFKSNGANCYVVELCADFEERLVRNKSENRLLHKESKRNLEWSEAEMRKTSEKYQLNSYDGESLPFENYIKIDNTTLAPDEVAKMIQTHFAIEGRKE